MQGFGLSPLCGVWHKLNVGCRSFVALMVFVGRLQTVATAAAMNHSADCMCMVKRRCKAAGSGDGASPGARREFWLAL